MAQEDELIKEIVESFAENLSEDYDLSELIDQLHYLRKHPINLNNTTPEELKKLSAMVVAAEKYEDEVLGLKPQKEPETIAEAVEIKMFENKMSQTKLAEELGLAKSKLSELLSGKRKPDVQFLKVLYKVLKIDAGFLLEHA